ncbi:MAG: hypothetical protein SVE93_04580 [Candidatus Thermoplasmatota archaeon]|nr:hypothetical protein [Candidatus Thermoplasmatota archaeon]
MTFGGGDSLSTINSLAAVYVENFEFMEGKSCVVRAGEGELIACSSQYRG